MLGNQLAQTFIIERIAVSHANDVFNSLHQTYGDPFNEALNKSLARASEGGNRWEVVTNLTGFSKTVKYTPNRWGLQSPRKTAPVL
jgi:hypothetical protein